MQRRPFGTKPDQLSIIGFGGIIVSGEQQAEANRLVAEAIDEGVNYFDVAPQYGDAQERLGPALVGKRDNVFLACKTLDRSKEGALSQLHDSLEKLKTDRFDLYQLHAMTTEEDFATVTGPGGALEAFQEARDQGLVRYLGFSAHSSEIAMRLLDTFPFDSVLFPVSWTTYFNADFGPQVLKKAEEKGAACLALKAMAMTVREKGSERTTYPKAWYHPIPEDEAELAELALRFTLSQRVTAAVPPGEASLFRLAVECAKRFQPITPDEEATLRERARGLAPLFHLAG